MSGCHENTVSIEHSYWPIRNHAIFEHNERKKHNSESLITFCSLSKLHDVYIKNSPELNKISYAIKKFPWIAMDCHQDRRLYLILSLLICSRYAKFVKHFFEGKVKCPISPPLTMQCKHCHEIASHETRFLLSKKILTFLALDTVTILDYLNIC
jgi:hypothetical protein